MFCPKGIDYIFFNYTNIEKFFLIKHYFIYNFFFRVQLQSKKILKMPSLHCSKTQFFFNQSEALQMQTKTQKKKINSRSYIFYSTMAFGFKDFLSSTSFSNFFASGQLETYYGLDIIFLLHFFKNKKILKPTYFLSSFQMPFQNI